MSELNRLYFHEELIDIYDWSYNVPVDSMDPRLAQTMQLEAQLDKK